MLSIIVYLSLGTSIGVWVGHFLALNYLSQPSTTEALLSEQAEIIETARQLNYQAWIASSALHNQTQQLDGTETRGQS